MINSEYAVVSSWAQRQGNTFTVNATAVATGALLLSVLAQIAIPLPFTPVPITGQTLGVAFVSLLWGRRLGFSSVLVYLFMGMAGLPVFAQGQSGLSFGPTLGYLVGMVVASYVMGSLADAGKTKTFARTLAITYLGSFITFTCGLAVLAFFVPAKLLLISGLLPFLPGDLIKNLIVSSIISFKVSE